METGGERHTHDAMVEEGESDTSDTLAARERAHILRVCQATGWKIKGPAGAANILGLNAGTLYWRMKKLGLKRPAVP